MSTAIVKGTLPSTAEIAVMETMANNMARSGLLPDAFKQKPASVFLAIQLGRELGLQPMQAISGINVIKGKPSISPALMAALILNGDKGSYKIIEFTNEKSVIEFTRDGVTTKFEFTIEDAVKAGLTDKDNWRNYPKNMLYARNMANGARMIFPDVVQGLHTFEELAPDVEVTAEGEPVEGSILEVVESELLAGETIGADAQDTKEAAALGYKVLEIVERMEEIAFYETLSEDWVKALLAFITLADGSLLTDKDIWKDLPIADIPNLLNPDSRNDIDSCHEKLEKEYKAWSEGRKK